MGDVSQGRLITVNNYYEIFNGILNPKQLEGLRLLVTQFPQKQFNATEHRRTDRPDGKLGVTCFDCHANGHSNGANHLVGDMVRWIKPKQLHRNCREKQFLTAKDGELHVTLPPILPIIPCTI